jgi:hypothetical protein
MKADGAGEQWKKRMGGLFLWICPAAQDVEIDAMLTGFRWMPR